MQLCRMVPGWLRTALQGGTRGPWQICTEHSSVPWLQGQPTVPWEVLTGAQPGRGEEGLLSSHLACHIQCWDSITGKLTQVPDINGS